MGNPVVKIQPAAAPFPAPYRRPKRPHAPKPDLTMPTAPAPAATYTTGKPKPDLPPTAGSLLFFI
ncbi:hypothetical protein [Neisseria dumasiana]|uniref:Uncharacterized protein n=1 Tax=Neisseria dumasiana TaxID=1931275 RepID=A0A1X3D4R0_9NEIS|nr:hypothetical protein [Neisseria dumasiana]OSI14919.1 hypothetical protein BV912_12250 [Neisseria dumasiana]